MFPTISRRIFQRLVYRTYEKDDDVLFMLLKDDKSGNELTAGDFYPIGISARVEGIDDSENVQIRTLERVDISDIEVADNHITATASIRGEISDISDEEEAELFQNSGELF